MVSKSPKDRVVGPLPNGRFMPYKWGAHPNHLLSGMILQAWAPICWISSIFLGGRWEGLEIISRFCYRNLKKVCRWLNLNLNIVVLLFRVPKNLTQLIFYPMSYVQRICPHSIPQKPTWKTLSRIFPYLGVSFLVTSMFTVGTLIRINIVFLGLTLAIKNIPWSLGFLGSPGMAILAWRIGK